MFWLIPVVGATYALYQWLSGEHQPSSSLPLYKEKTVLELNFSRLSDAIRLRSTVRVAVVGQPGSGKSSVIDSLSKGRCSPRPIIGPETDATNWSGNVNVPLVLDDDKIAYADAPGWDTERHPVDAFRSSFPFSQFQVVLFVFSKKLRAGDLAMCEHVHELMSNGAGRLICVRTFSEALAVGEETEVRDDFARLVPRGVGATLVLRPGRADPKGLASEIGV